MRTMKSSFNDILLKLVTSHWRWGEGSYYIEIAMTDFCGGGQNFDFWGILRKMMLYFQLLFGYTRFFWVTLKCVKDSFSRKGLLFAKRSFIFAKRTFIMAKTINKDYV